MENEGLFYMIHGNITYVDEALYEDKLSTVFDDLGATRETQDRVHEFVRNHPTVYCGTHRLAYCTIEDRLTYKHWYCGHYHTDKTVDRLSILFESYTELT